MELYELAKKLPKKDDISTDIYTYEKEKEEYTFAPRTSKPKVEVQPVQIVDPMIDQAIERMKKGREERERVKKSTERQVSNSGMRFELQQTKFKKQNLPKEKPKPANNSKGKDMKRLEKAEKLAKEETPPKQLEKEVEIKPETEKDAVPNTNNEEKLYIDVNLGDSVQRIVVHKGDTAIALAKEFAAEHSIVELNNDRFKR